MGSKISEKVNKNLWIRILILGDCAIMDIRNFALTCKKNYYIIKSNKNKIFFYRGHKQFPLNQEQLNHNFILACANNNMKEAKRLLNIGCVSLKYKNNQCIKLAKFHNHIEMVNILENLIKKYDY